MKIVLAFGTFDKFHPGHEFVLRKAKQLGDYLVVVVARDKNVQHLKKKTPSHTEQQRTKQVQNFETVDLALLGFQDFSRRMEIIDLINPDVIALGYDQAPHFVCPNEEIEVVRLAPFQPEKYKSSLL